MSSDFSDYMANAILAWLGGTAMPSAPANVYVALYDGDPGFDGASGVDVTDDVRSAGRVAITWGSIASRVRSNSADIDFGNSESAVQLTHYGVWDAQSGGNLLFKDALEATRNVQIGDPVAFLAGDLRGSFANP